MSVGLGQALAAAIDPATFARGAGFEPDEWQAKALRSPSPRLLFCCARQTGKSETGALMALHTAIHRPESLVLLVSPGERQSSELFRKVARLYDKLGRPLRAEAESLTRLEFTNGSRVVGVPGSERTVRGFSAPALIIADEASRIEDSYYRALAPMLATGGGRFVVMSTPFGVSGWFWQLWHEGGPEWERFRVPATACPRISAAFLSEQRRSMPAWSFAQEFECQFREDAGAAVFDADAVDALADEGAADWSDLLPEV